MQENENLELGDISILCRSLVEQMDGVVFFFSKDFEQLLYVSPQVKKILGYSSQKIMDNTVFWKNFIYSPDIAVLEKKILEMIRTQKDSRFEVKAKRVDEKIIDVSVYLKLIQNKEGGSFVWQVSAFDITQQKTFEREARENQIRTQAILGAIPDMIFVIAQNGVIRECYISEAFSKHKKPGDYLGKNYLELLPPEQQDVVKDYMNKIITEQIPKIFKYPVKHGNKFRFYETRGMPLSEEDEILFIIRDITQQVEAEKALKESEARYRDLINGIADAVLLTDLEGVITFVNEKAREVFNSSAPENLLGTNLYDLVPEDQRQDLKKQIKRLNLYGGDTAILLDIFKENCTFPGEISISLTYDHAAAPSGYIFVIRDVTERVRAEEELTLANEKLRETVARLEEINRETLIHNEMNDLMQSSLKIEEAYAVIAQYAEELYEDQSGALLRLNDTHTLLEIVAAWGEIHPDELIFPSDQCWALRRGRMHVVPDENYRLRCEHHSLPRYESYLCVPLIAQGKTFGILYQQVKGKENLARFEQMTKTFSERIALALANLELGESLRMQSIRDPLTGLFNRRYMEETLERELRRAVRYKRPLGLLMLDLDHFKEVNDTYGHSAGDLLLEKLGGYLQSHIRKEDVACRYGGDEFIIILPESSLTESQKRAEQLRLGINQIIVQYKNQPLRSVEVSIGVTGYPDHADTSEAIMQIVDDALFKGKKGGRNRVFVAEPGKD